MGGRRRLLVATFGLLALLSVLPPTAFTTKDSRCGRSVCRTLRASFFCKVPVSGSFLRVQPSTLQMEKCRLLARLSWRKCRRSTDLPLFFLGLSSLG